MSHGINNVPFSSADQHSAPADCTDAPMTGERLCVAVLIVSVGTTMAVTFKCETTGVVVAGPFYVLANTTVCLMPPGDHWKLATADKKLQVVTSVSGNVMVDAFYRSEP